MVETRRLSDLVGRLTGLLDIPDGRWVVGLSGGADSAALAYLLSTMGEPRAVHVNHGLPASVRLEAAASEIAARLGMTLEVAHVEVPDGPSPEGMARRARYEALLPHLGAGEVLLTAHTLEDQAETVMMNLIRGTGPSGLAGIPRLAPPLARPLLDVSRSETRELAALAGLPFLDDPTNFDPTLRRNAIRLEVLPDLSARFNPRLTAALARLAALLRSDEDLLEEEARLVPILTRGAVIAVPIGALVAVPRPVADRALRLCLGRARPPHSGTAAEMAQIWAVATGEQGRAQLAGDLEVAVEGPLLLLTPGERVATTEPDVVELSPGVNRVDGFELEVEKIDRVCRVAPLGTWSAIFPPAARLRAQVRQGRVIVEADGVEAWVVGERRLPVAWYQPGSSGYLCVFATEDTGWTSSP
jgi:tRNA(Ile)-lysidine synthase